MKKVKIFLVLLIVFGLTVTANAALVDNGDGTITDTDTSLMWMRQAFLGYTSWDSAMNFADSYSFSGYYDWRLPSAYNSDGSGPCFPYNCDDSEMGHLHYSELRGVAGSSPPSTFPFQELRTDVFYWSSTTNSSNPSLAHNFNFRYGLQDYNSKGSAAAIMLVRDISVVPEPISSVLFIVGGATLGFRRFRRGTK
jgi:hypothetical protein